MKKPKPKILLTCAGGSAMIYLARKLQKKYDIFLADASKESIAQFFGFPYRVIPFGNGPKYIPALVALIKKWKIDCIVPGADEELLAVAKLRDVHKDIFAIIPSTKFIALCLNKKDTMHALARIGVSYLLPYTSKKLVRYPAVVKPISGRGSRGVHIVSSREELGGYLALYKKKFEDVLVQQHIEGEEYTISVIVNDQNEVIGIVPKRAIEKRGITRIAIAEHNALIEKNMRVIVDELRPCGLFNVQLKLLNNKIYIFEINPRLSTTAVLTDKAFGNEVELCLKYKGKTRVANPPRLKTGIKLFRYEENVFIGVNGKKI